MTKLRTAGLLLIAGSAITLALHFLEAPEEFNDVVANFVGRAVPAGGSGA